jgi:hypothetical protein
MGVSMELVTLTQNLQHPVMLDKLLLLQCFWTAEQSDACAKLPVNHHFSPRNLMCLNVLFI